MPGKIAVPTQLLVPNTAVGRIQRRLVLRNVSAQDMLVKLVVSKQSQDVIQLEHEKVRLAPRVTLQVNVTIDCDKMTSFNRVGHKISGFAMPILAHNVQNIGEWLNTPGAEKPRQLAFDLALLVSKDFSANDIVLDMPGLASLIEPISQAVPLTEQSDVRTARDIDVLGDTLTARAYGSQEEFVNQLKAAELKNKANSCWLMDAASKYFVPCKDSSAPKKDQAKPNGETSQKSVDRSDRSIQECKSNKGADCTSQRSAKTQSFGKSAKKSAVNSELNATPCGGN